MSAAPSPHRVVHYRTPWLSLSETFVHETVRRHRRYQPVILTHERKNAEAFPSDAPLEVIRESGVGAPGSRLRGSAALRIRARRRALGPALRRLGPSLLHAHFGEEGVVAAAEARRLGIPLAVSFYGFDATHLGAHALWRRRFRSLFRTAHLVLAEGPHLRDRLLELGCPPERARIQRIPVRLERFSFRPRSRPAEGPVVFLQACRLVAKKGVDLTVEAFARLAGEWPEAELRILGDGPERPGIEERVSRAGLGERVRLLGMRDHEEYARVMEEAHVFVQPSRTAADGDGEGGAPTTLLEAQASGLPLVTSDHADIPWVVAPDGALMVPEGDVDALAGAMERLLAHPEEWEARAEAGRRKVEEDHDPERLATRLEALYDEARGMRQQKIAGARAEPEVHASASSTRGDTPLVSVVIPTRDRAELLERAMKSVLAQTVDDLELIVVNDGSADETPGLLEDYRRMHPRLVVVSLARSVGGAAARNEGIERARGRFIGFLDDDDEWFPFKLERQLRQLDEAGGEVAAAYSPHILRWEDGREVLGWAPDISGEEPLRRLLRGVFIATSSLLVRRESLQLIGGFDPELKRLQDWDLCMRLARVARFAYCAEPLHRAHATPGSVSRRDEHLIEPCHLIRRKAERWPELGTADLADLDCTLGHLMMVADWTREARRQFRRSLKNAPFHPRHWILAVLAHASPSLYTTVVRAHRHWVLTRADRSAAEAVP